MKALLDVFTERQRQIDSEGWATAHDDEHNQGELAAAGAAYAAHAEDLQQDRQLLDAGAPAFWPFEKSWWKPSDSPRRNLIKAAALLLAEIERLDRAEASDSAPAATTECWSLNDDEYRWTDLQELIDDNEGELEAGQTIYVGTADHPDAASYIYDASEVTDRMGEAASEHLCDYAGDYPNPNPNAEKLLNAFLKAWAREHCPPHFFEVKDSRPYVLTEEDLLGQDEEFSS